MENANQNFSIEELNYFVNGYLNKVTRMDVTLAKRELASEMGRSFGSMTYHQKHVLNILTNGEEGKDNYSKDLPAVVNEIRQDRNMTISKMTYWFE